MRKLTTVFFGLTATSTLVAQITSTGTAPGTNWTGAGTWTSGPGATQTGYGGYPGQVAPDRQDGFPPTIYITPNGSTINNTHSPVHTHVEGAGVLDIDPNSFHASQQIGYTLAGGYQYLGGGGTGYVDTPDTLDLGQRGLGSGTLNLTTGAMLEVGMSNGGVFLRGTGQVQDGTFFPNGGSDDRTTSPGSNGVMPNGGVNGHNQSQQAADYSVLAAGQGSAPGDYRDQTAWHAQNNPNRQFDLPADPAANPINPAFYQPSNLAQGGQVPGTRANNQAMPLYEAGGFFNIGDDDNVHASGSIVSHQSPLTPGISTNGQTSTLKGQFNMDGGVLNVVQYGWGWNGVERKDWHFANGNDDQSRFEGWELDPETGAHSTGLAGNAREDANVDGAVQNLGGNFMYVDPALYTRGTPGGNSTAPFPDPGGNSWRQTDNMNQNLDPFDVANNPNLDPFYLQIARSGGNIRVGNNHDSSGEFNISNGMVTTNNLEVGRFRDAYGVVNQVGGDIYIREDVSLAGRTGGNANTGIYNLGDDGANNVFDSDNENGRVQFNNDNSAVSGTYFGQYYGRTATGGALSDWDNVNQPFGTDGNNTGATGHTTLLTSQYDAGTFMTDHDTGTYADAPTPEAAAPIGGGILEIARDLLVGQRGLGIFNMNLAETWTDENGVVRDSFFVVGDDILLASSENNAVGIFNYDSTVDILASNRQWRFDADQRIVIGDNANDGSNALGIFNYNPGSGLIGNDTTDAFSGNNMAAVGVNPRFDRIQVGEGRHSTGYFNHNNENVISLDNEIEIGDQSDSFGILNLLGDPTTQQGGIHADDGIVVGEAGTGVLNQTGQTTVESWEAGNNVASFGEARDIVIAQYHESTDEGNNNGTAADAERAGNLSGQGRRSYGEYNFGLPSQAELTAGQVVGGSFAQKEGYHDQGTDDTPSILVNDLRIGEGGDGSFNHYANSDLTTTASNGGPGDIDIGGQNYGVGEYNLVNNTGVTVTAADDIEIGEAGKGTFNQGMYAAVTGPDGVGYNQLDPTNPASKLPDGVTAGTGYTPDTYDPNAAGANSMVVATGDIVVGGSTAYDSRNEESQNFTTIIRDSGEGHYNLNGTGADFSAGGTLRIGTGDNVQEGIMYRDDQGNNPTMPAIDGDVGGLGNETLISRQADVRNTPGGVAGTRGPRDARVPWMNAAGTDFLAWDGQSAQVDIAGASLAGNNMNTEGAAFNTALQGTAFGTGAIWQDDDDTAYGMVAGPADGQGSIGVFNHNNDVNKTYAQADITIGDGDNSQGFYNQNGTGNVTMAGDLEMSVDRYDAGNATIAPSAAVGSAGGNGTGYDALGGGYNTNGGFEMGQSTFTVNNTSAILDLAGNNVVGDSIDVAGGGGVTTAAGGGGQIPDHMAGGAMQMKDNPQATGTQWALINRDNEAQINLFEGEIRNTRDVNADIYQFGGHFDMGQSTNGVGPVTTNLQAGMHDFIQMETNTPYTNPLTWDMADISADGDVNPISGKPGSTIEFNWFDIDGNLDAGAPSGVGMNTGTVMSDTLLADHIQLNADPGSIQIDLSGMPAGYFTNLTLANNGDYWNLLDWTDDFTWGVGGGLLEPGTGGLSNDTDITDNANDLMAFDFGLGMGVLPTLTSTTGQTYWWSIDPNGPGGIEGVNVNTPAGTDIFQTHGILYIYTIPEPSRAMLLAVGLGALFLRRRR